jgi:hypothetical protein
MGKGVGATLTSGSVDLWTGGRKGIAPLPGLQAMAVSGDFVVRKSHEADKTNSFFFGSSVLIGSDSTRKWESPKQINF